MPIFTLKDATDTQDEFRTFDLLAGGSLQEETRTEVWEILAIENAVLDISDETLQFLCGSGSIDWPGQLIRILFDIGRLLHIERFILYRIVNTTEAEILLLFSSDSTEEKEYVGQLVKISGNPNLENTVHTNTISQYPVKGIGIDMAVPVGRNGLVVWIDNTDAARTFTEDEIAIITPLALLIATAYNAWDAIHKMGIDGLTGLPNRLVLDRAIDGQIDIFDTPIPATKTVAMVDIDFFKNFNTEYGHDVGDAVLRHVAYILGQEAKRLWGKACRYGGEEFTLIFPKSMTPEEIDSVRVAVESSECEFEWKSYNVKISIGFVTEDPNSGIEPDARRLIKNADVALYVAKNNGRNCTVQGS